MDQGTKRRRHRDAEEGPTDTKVAVGATQAADGSMEGQMEFLLGKIEDFRKAFWDSWVPRKMAWTGLRMMIWPSFAFPLAACTFSLDEVEELTKELRKLTVVKLGIARSFPHVYLHVPLCLQGLNFPHAEIEQGVEHIGKMLTHGDTSLLTSQWLMLNLEQAQLEVGIRVPLLEPSYEQYGFLCTNCWIKVLWWFISTYEIWLMDRKFQPPSLQCKGDEFIMERLVMLERFNEAALLCINWCRIKLQVLTMADIIAGNGIHLQRDAHVYTYLVGLPRSRYNWAREELGHGNWILWGHALKAVMSKNGALPFFNSLG